MKEFAIIINGEHNERIEMRGFVDRRVSQLIAQLDQAGFKVKSKWLDLDVHDKPKTTTTLVGADSGATIVITPADPVPMKKKAAPKKKEK